MMAAPVPFLERLASAATGHGTVRPALPPRFTSLRLEAPPGEPVAPSPLPHVGPDSSNQPEVRPEGRSEQQIPPYTPRRHEPAPSPAAATLPRAVSEVALSRPAVADPAPGEPPQIAVMTSPRRPEAAPAANGDRPLPPPGRDLEHGSSGGDTPAPVLISRPPAAPPVIEVHPPLRELVVLQHAATGARVGPSEVHVVIDRIEVRAPAPVRSREASRPAPKPRSAPSLSLADYLRKPGSAR